MATTLHVHTNQVAACGWPPPPTAADSSNPGSSASYCTACLACSGFRRAKRVRPEGPMCAVDCLASAAARGSAGRQARVSAGGVAVSEAGQEGKVRGKGSAAAAAAAAATQRAGPLTRDPQRFVCVRLRFCLCLCRITTMVAVGNYCC